jgi:hypothetical protein
MKRERERLLERRKDIAAELEALDAEIAGIDAYFNAMTSPGRGPRSTRQPRTSGSDRAARGSVQTTVFDLINENPECLTRSEIVAKLPEVQAQTIANALATFVKTGRINFEGRGGKYRPITIEPTPPPATNE